MSKWNDIKPRFRKALFAAFDPDSLTNLLGRHFDEQHISLLDESSKKDTKTISEINVDIVIAYAERRGGLENLAADALAEKEDYRDLRVTVQEILAGVAENGKEFYQSAPGWKEIERSFREALISGFNWNGLAVVLQYHCSYRLDRISSAAKPYDTNVDEVIADAVRKGWLENLAHGALIENRLGPDLKDTVPYILAGVAAEGKKYYQGSAVEPPPTVPEGDKVLEAAIRSEVEVGADTSLFVLVRDQDSTPSQILLKVEPEHMVQDEDVRESQPFKLHYPVDESGNLLPAPVEIVVTSKDFYPAKQSKHIEIPPGTTGRDETKEQEFILTPIRTGPLGVLVEVYQLRENQSVVVESRPVSTLCLDRQWIRSIYRYPIVVLSLIILILLGWASYEFVAGLFASSCTDTPIQLEYESADTVRRVVQGNIIPVEPGSELHFFAVPFGENIDESRFICDWEYEGDGEAITDGCQVVITTGVDSDDDSITAIVHQSRCPSFARESALITPVMGEGG